MTAFILYWIFASIFLITLAYLYITEDREEEHSSLRHWSALIMLCLLVTLAAPILLPIALAHNFYEHSQVIEDKLKEIKEKKKRLFKDDD